MNPTKDILIFFFIVMVCVAISALGVYLLDEKIAKLYLGFSLSAIPLIAIISIIYSQMRTK